MRDMRPLVGVILAIVMAAVLFFAASWGYLKLETSRVALGALPPGGGASLWHDRAVLEGFGALAATGLVAGLLIAMPRISPRAAGLPGLVLLAWTGLYLSSARRAVQYIPLKTRPYGAGFEDLLFDGVLALAGQVRRAQRPRGPRGPRRRHDLVPRLTGDADHGRWQRFHLRLARHRH